MFVIGFVCLLLHATGSRAFSVTTTTPNLRVPENEGADLKCAYTGDFGNDARVEWKFKDLKKGSQGYVVYADEITSPYAGRVTKYNGGLRINKVTRKDTGEYDCEVSGSLSGAFGEAKIKLIVLVPPSVPLARIPTSVTNGRSVLLTCRDNDGSPPPTYKWFYNKTPLPEDPTKVATFKNATYKMNTQNGNLEFPSVSLRDTGDYYCEAFNGVGPAKSSAAARMEVRDVNTGGIVAGVIVALLAVGLLIFGLWFAKRKGYLPKSLTESKPKSVVYTQPTSDYGDEEDGEFRQKSSFVV